MMSGAPEVVVDENATGNYNPGRVKKLTLPSGEANPKRAPLGGLQISEMKDMNGAEPPGTVGNALALEKEPFGALKQQKGDHVDTSKQLPDCRLHAVPLLLVPQREFSGGVSRPSQRLAVVKDIDANDGECLPLVSEYVNDIYNYLYELEDQQPICADHLANQLEVTPKMRAELIDWINSAHFNLGLLLETFHLSVSIIDRYLQVVKDTKREYFQLVGVTALLIAIKYEERTPPLLSEVAYIMDVAYTAEEIQQMELQILKAIDNNMSRPLSIQFLRRYSKAAEAICEHHTVSKYFLELASMDYALASCKPSQIAAASLFLSLHLFNGNPNALTDFNDKLWTPTLVHYSRYTASHLHPVARKIAKIALSAPTATLKSVYSKYQTIAFEKIALRPELSSPLMDSIAGVK